MVSLKELAQLLPLFRTELPVDVPAQAGEVLPTLQQFLPQLLKDRIICMLGLALVGDVDVHVELGRTLDDVGHEAAGESVFACAHERRELLGCAGDNHADMRLLDLLVDEAFGSRHARYAKCLMLKAFAQERGVVVVLLLPGVGQFVDLGFEDKTGVAVGLEHVEESA